MNLTKHDYKILCIFLFSVWLTGNKARNDGNNYNYIYVFESIEPDVCLNLKLYYYEKLV
jgi:hypothetical protein